MATFKTLRDTTQRDRARALRLRVIRFWNSAVLTNRDGVSLTILEVCGGEHPSVGSG